MAISIRPFDPSRLHKEEASVYHEIISELTAECTAEQVQPALADFNAKLSAYLVAMKPGRKSPITARLVKLDNERHRLFVAFRAFIRVNLNHFIPRYATIARAVYDIIRKYGQVHRKNYMEESGSLSGLVEDLLAYDRAESESRLDLIGAKVWVDEIKRVNDLFNDSFMERLESQSGITGRGTAARKAVDAACVEALRTINAYIALYGDEGMADMVAKINELIEYQIISVKIRNAKSASSKSPDGESEPDTDEQPENEENNPIED